MVDRRNKTYEEDLEDYTEEVTDLIVDMGNLMDPEQRKASARSIVGDYPKLDQGDAENFILDNEQLINEGVVA